MDASKLEHLLEHLTFRPYMLVLPKRIAKNSAFTDNNYRTFFECRIKFQYRELVLSVQAAETNSKISQKLLGTFLGNCTYLRSSENRERMSSLIDVSKQEAGAVDFNFKFWEARDILLKVQSRIYNAEEHKNLAHSENAIAHTVAHYDECLQKNRYYTNPSEEVLKSIFGLLANFCSEEELVQRWNVAVVKHVMGS